MNSAALQSALYSALSGDATLVALLSSSWGVTPIFSDVPQQNAEVHEYYPFISFGAATITEMDDKDFTGGNELMQVNIWTRTNDYIEARTIADRVSAVLHKQSLTITGANHIETRRESVTLDLDPDGHTRRALMLFRVTYFDS